jgi:hypothetical protein
MQTFRDVDPAELRTPSSRPVADPGKLARQISRYGRSVAGMPPLIVYESTDGHLVIYDGVTRATRVAKLLPGQFVRVVIVGRYPGAAAGRPTIKETLP